MFPRYLRLLDATSAGVRVPRLAEFFEEGDDTISRQLEKAMAMRDGGYLKILEK
jgi:hypothetical protein